MILLVVLFVGLIVVVALSMQGYKATQSGVENMACTSAKILDVTLSGQASTQFIGMVPLLNIISGLDQKLNDNSALLSDVQGVLDSTGKVERAVTVASETLSLLSDMMEDPANRRPTLGGQDLLHRCYFCEQLPPLLRPAVDALNNGVGTALAEARAEVSAQLSPQRRSDLQSRLRETAQPLMDVKKLVRDSFYFFVEERRYEKVKEYVSGSMPPLLGVILFVVLANALLLCCGCCTSACWQFREKSPNTRRYENPYYTSVPCCACWSWCCGFFYAFFALLVGGLLVVAMVAMSSVCLVLDDLGSQTVHDIAPVAGLNLTGDQGVMLTDIIDQCFSQPAAANSSNLMELIFTRENGTRVTMRSKIITSLKDQIQSRFDLIAQRMSILSSWHLSNSSEVELLRASVRSHPLDAMLLPEAERMQADPLYSGLRYDSRGSDGVLIGLNVSAACADVVIGPSMGNLSSQTVPGILRFVDRLKHFGTELPGPTCARHVLCSATLNPFESTACTAGNNYVALKNRLLNATFKCNKFQLANGATCDPLNMYRTGTTWYDDCLHNDGSMHVKELTCDLQAFTQYVAQFETRIDSVFKRLDEAVAEVHHEISVRLRQLVDEHVVRPIGDVADGVTCSFLGVYYREMVDGLCYQTVPGLWVVGWTYVACGALAFLFIILMYVTWRRAIDNRLEWKPFVVAAEDEDEDPVVEVDGIGKGRILAEGAGTTSV